MRIDSKVEGPRQSMSWLHTWASLVLGWLLYAIFVTGTLSFFQSEITVWMKPEFHQSVPNPSQLQQTRVAVDYLQQNHPDAGSWNIQLPNSRQNTTNITIRQQGEDLNARRGGERISIDSATGEVLEARETRGGNFLYRFHFELYGLPRLWTRWLIGLATMLMLVAIVSGIITHKKIFKDFFTFRAGKGQRSWLDAHNATAVFALPFHIMITFSGLLLLLFTFMPWGVNQIYENRSEFLKDQRQSLIAEKAPEPNEKHTQGLDPQLASGQARGSGEGRGNRGRVTEGQSARGEGRGQRGEGRRHGEPSQPAPLADLTPLLLEANKAWGNNPVSVISILAPNTSKAKIEFRALKAASVAHRGVYATLDFNGVTGKNVSDQSSALRHPSIPNGIYNVITVLHEARGLDLALRWMLFFSGVAGTLMIATGLILWCVKRAPQQQKQGYKSFGYRLVEVTNIAAIMGLPIACAAYFYANRLIPTELEMRLNWEIRAFFIVWLLTLIYAIFRTHRQAWLDLLMFATIAFALLPIINPLTGGKVLWSSLADGQWLIATFDLAMWILAMLFFFAFLKVKNHTGLPVKKGRASLGQESTS